MNNILLREHHLKGVTELRKVEYCLGTYAGQLGLAQVRSRVRVGLHPRRVGDCDCSNNSFLLKLLSLQLLDKTKLPYHH